MNITLVQYYTNVQECQNVLEQWKFMQEILAIMIERQDQGSHVLAYEISGN